MSGQHAGPGLADAGTAPPASEEAEVSVLGAMLIAEDARKAALERLEAEDFHHAGRRRIFAAFEELHGRGQEADVTTLADELRSSDQLEAAGGMSYLAQLVDAVPTADNVESYADRLRELRALRELQRVTREVAREAQGAGPGEGPSVLETLRDGLRAVEGRGINLEGDGLRTALEILEDPDARVEPPVVADRLAWRGRTVMFAGREKSGKSSLWRWAVAQRSRGLRVWGGVPVGGPIRTLYWGEEPPVDVAADLDRFGADLGQIHVRDMRGVTGDRFAVLRRDIEEVEPHLVVIDTLPTFVDDREMDSGGSSDWAPVMNRLSFVALDYDVAMGILHHANKHDGSYRDSTAIGAGVDAILEMRRDPGQGDNVRKVTAYPRSSIRVESYRYRMVGTEGEPRMELCDGSLPLEVRILSHVRRHQDCSQRSILDGVRGRKGETLETLEELVEAEEIDRDSSGRSHSYRIPENPGGNGPGTVGNGLGNDGTGSRGESVPEDPGAL